VLTLKGTCAARKTNALALGLGLAATAPLQEEMTYEGRLVGRAFVGKVKRDADTRSLLGAEESEVVGIVNDDGKSIELFEDYKEGRMIVARG
jgi:hypothetical protein